MKINIVLPRNSHGHERALKEEEKNIVLFCELLQFYYEKS